MNPTTSIRLALAASLSLPGLPAAVHAEPRAAHYASEASVPSLPVVAERRYRVMARVRPLLFWVGKDDVGAARVRWHAGTDGASGLTLLIGSDPDRAPRRINRWGYIAEEHRDGAARLVGVMRQTREHSLEDAQAQVARDAAAGQFVYTAIRSVASSGEARAGITTLRLDRDLTYRDLPDLLARVTARDADREHSTALPAGTRPGFLFALQELVQASVRASSDGPAPSRTVRRLPYVYNGRFFELALLETDRRPEVRVGGRAYRDVARGQFEIRSRGTGDITRFQLTYGLTGTLSGVPVHAVYQPKWWFEVQLFLDDDVRF